LGWAGWNSRVYPIAIERFAIPLKARIWLWAFFFNDLPESAGADDFLSSDETNYLEWITEEGKSTSDLTFPFNLRTIQLLAAIFNPDLFLLPGSGSIVFDNGTFHMRVSDNSWEVTDPQSAQVQHGWELTEQALLRTHELAQQNDATLVVIFIPSREYVYWPYIKDALPDLNIHQLDDVETRLAIYCSDQNIDYLNLLPDFRALAERGNVVFSF